MLYRTRPHHTKTSCLYALAHCQKRLIRAGILALLSGAISFSAQAGSSNPVLDFDTILFHGYDENGGESHMCDQYYGWNARMGGGLYKLTGFKTGGTPVAIDFLKNSIVQNGRFKGTKLAGGAFLSPDLSYDGKTIVFAWTLEETNKCYHLFKVNIDGSNLVQLTDGASAYDGLRYWNLSQNDFDPCWLPSGRIVFISERRGGYLRCSNARPCPTYTLFSMKDDGTDIIPISYHETNEWHPSVNNDGMIVYTRWDYVDRDDCIAHHLWTCYPDGRDPRAPHGNYPLPFSTITPGYPGDGRGSRPIGEWNIRAIPNSNKYVATAGPHHGHSFGDLVVIDPTIPDDGMMAQVVCISTPGKVQYSDAGGPWGTAWPLSEDYFLCNYNNNIRLLKKDGTYEDLYSSSVGRPVDPIPLRSRTKPLVLSMGTWQGERASLPDHHRATLSVMNVYNGDLSLPAGVKIKSMRIMQIIPQLQSVMNVPRIGYPSEALARLSLGTVPVEDDGSVYCEAPVAKEVYFQLLDDKGMAVHSMRSGTYVHAGEQLTCYGCHENKWQATPPLTTVPTALRRAPSKLIPEPGAEPSGITPINYYRLVKPIFDAKCVVCHAQKGQGPQDMSYSALPWNYVFYKCGNGNPFLNGDITTAIAGGSRSTPGSTGAHYSIIGKALLDSTHQKAGITSDEFRRVTLWLDGNSNELSAYTQVDAQRQGRFVWPDLDVDTLNPTGVESSFPLPGTATHVCSLHAEPQVTPMAFKAVGSRIAIAFNSGSVSKVQIFDILGHSLGSLSMPPDTREAQFDLSVFARSRGAYFVRVYNGAGTCIGSRRISALSRAK